jgi:DNA-binding NtrC family response regulator
MRMGMARLLVVDDEPVVRRALAALLGSMGLEVTTAEDGVDAEAKLRGGAFDLIITDLKMPRADGFAVLKAVREHQPRVPAIMLTGHGSIGDCVTAMRAGAWNFLTKPFHEVELEQIVRDALAQAAAASPAQGTPAQAGSKKPRTRAGAGRERQRPQAALLGESPKLRAVLDLIDQVARTDATVLITGDTGTGKEVAARLLHGVSARAGSPFVAVNCGAIPDGLIESELFGHARGAFTGATERRTGKFALAEGGTIFLDEIGELPLALQVKLLRVLQDREITPVGDSHAQPIDVRVVAATHRDLDAMVAGGAFREDLYYRLHVVVIEMPRLRDRPEDVPLLAEYFLESAARRQGRALTLSPDAMALLQGYFWPGNVRELENLIERLAIVMRGDHVLPEHLPARLRAHAAAAVAGARTQTAGAPAVLGDDGINLPGTLAKLEERLIDEALRKAGGNKNRAATLLGINRTTLVEKLKRRS